MHPKEGTPKSVNTCWTEEPVRRSWTQWVLEHVCISDWFRCSCSPFFLKIGKTAEHYAANRETELVFKKRRASSAERTQRQEPEQQEIVVSPANQRQGKIAADKTTTGSEKSGTEQEVGKINGEEDAEGDSPEVDHKDKRGKGHKKWKRVKDHKFEWSDDFKARQKQTVFDRLMGGGKKWKTSAATREL